MLSNYRNVHMTTMVVGDMENKNQVDIILQKSFYIFKFLNKNKNKRVIHFTVRDGGMAHLI